MGTIVFGGIFLVFFFVMLWRGERVLNRRRKWPERVMEAIAGLFR